MNFIREHWYYIGGIIFVILAFITVLFGSMLDPVRVITIALFMTMLLHQFEEYACPGGFPMYWNIGACGEKEKYDRYPLNKNSSAFSNVAFWFVYVAAIIWSDFYLLGTITAYMAFGQLMMHGVMINKKTGRKYNPGMGSLIIMVPVSIYYIWYIASHFDVPAWNWWVAVICLPFFLLALLAIPLKKLEDADSIYPWTKDEIERFHSEEKLGIK